jgi:arsenate reductase (thioredoxin)
MTEEYLRRFGGDLFQVESAGLEPGTLNPYVVRALREDGIDIAGKKTRDVFALFREGRTFTWVITVCSKEAAERCPLFPGRVRRLHWPFPDPSAFTGSDEEIMAQVRAVRDSIKVTALAFVEELRGGSRSTRAS